MYLSFTVVDIIQETSDTKSFVLSPDQPFKYQPGQFLTIVRGEARRSFSFSSHPSDKYPKVTIKRIANGEISRWMCDHVKVGEKISTIEASGLFTLPPDTSAFDTIFFLAAGSGITPIYSLIREAISKQKKLVLIYSNRSPEQTIFFKELQQFSKDVDLHFYFSNNRQLQDARLSRTNLENLVQKYMTSPERVLFYLCGPHVYMQNIAITLLTEGIPDDNIRREIFFNPEPPVVNIPPDTDMHTVTVRYEGKVHTFRVQFPKSILHTAKAQGVMLPYSCEAGRCGTCAATCTSGQVWMLRNEVLLDKEMSRGRVLTCTGFAVGGDADLTIDNV